MLKSGDLDEGLKGLEEALSLDPGNGRVLYNACAARVKRAEASLLVGEMGMQNPIGVPPKDPDVAVGQPHIRVVLRDDDGLTMITTRVRLDVTPRPQCAFDAAVDVLCAQRSTSMGAQDAVGTELL